MMIHWLALHWKWIVLVFCAFLFYLIKMLFSARRVALRSERKNVYVCDRHGPIDQDKECFMLDLGDGGKPIVQCIRCYEATDRKLQKQVVDMLVKQKKTTIQ